LNQISIIIEPNSKVGIIGRTGSGKSSLLLSFLRLNKIVNGDIKIGGVSTRDMELTTLRKMISWVPQEPTLFTGSIRFNLDPFGHYTDLDLIKKMELSGFLQCFNLQDQDAGEVLN